MVVATSHTVTMPYLPPLPFYYVTLQKRNCSIHMGMKLHQKWLKTNKDFHIIYNTKRGNRHKTERHFTADLCSLQRATEIYDNDTVAITE
jgi:hypothetical protein